jgi:hypothetical protein
LHRGSKTNKTMATGKEIHYYSVEKHTSYHLDLKYKPLFCPGDYDDDPYCRIKRGRFSLKRHILLPG